MKDKNLDQENIQIDQEEQFEYDIWGQRSDDPNYMNEPEQAFLEGYAMVHMRNFVPFEKQDEKKI